MRNIIILLSIFLTSCSPKIFYQVYKTSPIQNDIVANNNGYFYEDANCIVMYDFWEDGGNIGFVFYNKTDENIYLKLNECFFVSNDKAFDYFLNRIYEKSSSVGISNSSMTLTGNSNSAGQSSTGYDIFKDSIKTNSYLNTKSFQLSNSKAIVNTSSSSVSYKEKEIICIPPKTYKSINEYNIDKSVFDFCNFILYPTKKQIDTLKFNFLGSPLIFSNIIAYSKGDSDDIYKLKNTFYISEITNYPESEVIKGKYITECENDYFPIYKMIFEISSPTMFYNKYSSSGYISRYYGW